MLLRCNSDPQAPQVGIETDTFRKILKACLVTGFGSFDGLPWELKYDSATTSVFKSSADVLLVVDEDETTINLSGCCSTYMVSNYQFPNKHQYRFFPTIYQNPNGLEISKNSLIADWLFLGSKDYFYFFAGDLFIFFGKWDEIFTNDCYALILSDTFGLFSDTTIDHVLSKKNNNLFSPQYVGKKELFVDDSAYAFSSVNLYQELGKGAIVGALPNIFVPKLEISFADGFLNSSMGKHLLVHNFNGRSFLFDTNG